ncbi:hypothetical protein JOC77_003686 [Peribacillus deserti]|uniref:Uncharacterized protein n=1 Tax=Peribacillus deserti TaxID=673318 RepID=A0ABS2QMB1_9BACI|nr:DUF1761 domain-containing protein [Peribacillus deserti]MBM7694242.1 hypothetical protein [Peribacillus deserti]
MEGANTGYILTMIAAILTAYILSVLIHLSNEPTIATGAAIGFLAGLTASLRELSPTFFENRSRTLFLHKCRLSYSFHNRYGNYYCVIILICKKSF